MRALCAGAVFVATFLGAPSPKSELRGIIQIYIVETKRQEYVCSSCADLLA